MNIKLLNLRIHIGILKSHVCKIVYIYKLSHAFFYFHYIIRIYLLVHANITVDKIIIIIIIIIIY